MVRLDRFLITDDWEVLFEGARQSLLPKPLSDHHPILLEGETALIEAPYHLGSKTCGSRRKALKPLLMSGGRALRSEVLVAMF